MKSGIFSAALNAICPYYTMFPIEFPLRVLGHKAKRGHWVADPFCGRGTTNFAARLLGLPSVGIDSSPVAVALTKAKLARARASDIVRVAKTMLDETPKHMSVPQGDFWDLAYERTVLRKLCWLRHQLMLDCMSDSRIILRAILLGALHGPRTKTVLSHLSNQCPRTYAPKPNYAIRFWRKHRMTPPVVDILELLRRRAQRFLKDQPRQTVSRIELGDSRTTDAWNGKMIRWIVTSPPYYGMRTYVADQWLRSWFVGGPSKVEYARPSDELSHASSETFAGELKKVWQGLVPHCHSSAKLVIRFGGIQDRDVNAVELLKSSIRDSGWRLTTVISAGSADSGKRQSKQFLKEDTTPKAEHDYYAVLD
jgi:hypothetical protein